MIGTGNRENEMLLPGHTNNIGKADIAKIPEIIISTIQMQNGKQIDAVLDQWEELDRPVIGMALDQISLQDSGLQL